MLVPIVLIFRLVHDWYDFRTSAPKPPILPAQVRVMCSASNAKVVVPVWSKKNGSFVDAWVSPEDEGRVAGAAKSWYLSNTGYVVAGSRSNGKYTLTYLHKIILDGGAGSHLNSDRLDNRRCNLVRVERSAKRVFEQKEFVIQTPHLQATNEFEEGVVDYPGEKRYQGFLVGKKPHGYGILYDGKHISVGEWADGQFSRGVLVVLRQEARRDERLSELRIQKMIFFDYL